MKNINEAVVVVERQWNREVRAFELRYAARCTRTEQVGNAGLWPLALDGHQHDELLFNTYEEALAVVVTYNCGIQDDNVRSQRWDRVCRTWTEIEYFETGRGRDGERFYTP